MAEMVVIEPGELKLPGRNWSLSSAQAVPLVHTDTFTLLSGSNGAGKTTLVELFLLPVLVSQKISCCYLPQDLLLQEYIMRSELAVRGQNVTGGLTDVCRLWLRHNVGTRVLILDEYDKHGPVTELMSECSGLEAAVAVTHLPTDDLLHFMKGCFAHGMEVRLECPKGEDGHHRTLTGRSLWP